MLEFDRSSTSESPGVLVNNVDIRAQFQPLASNQMRARPTQKSTFKQDVLWSLIQLNLKLVVLYFP